MEDWGDFEDLVEFTNEIIEDQVVEERKQSVSVFMKAITQPAEYAYQKGKTPVSSGKLMANTALSINRVDNTSYDIEDEDGTETYQKAMSKLKTAKPYEKVYIQNNTKDEDNNYYALNADYKGWGSKRTYRFFTNSWMTMVNDAEEKNK